MDYCPGGNLYAYLQSRPNQKLSEDHARMYAAEVMLALQYLHAQDTIYRDLKPENIVLDEEGHCRLTDFGLSHLGVQANIKLEGQMGTLSYMAPEML